jgi:hypothetical protein
MDDDARRQFASGGKKSRCAPADPALVSYAGIHRDDLNMVRVQRHEQPSWFDEGCIRF